MTHDLPLLATIAVSLSSAFVFGLIAVRLKLPAIVGYMFAGVIVGPHTPGFVADMKIAEQLAEIGMIFLMFGVGLHFSLKDLMAIKKIAIIGATGQITVAILLGTVVATCWGWPIEQGFILGLSLSVASTVVLLKGLESTASVDGTNKKIAIGWLVIEDIVMIIVLVLLPIYAQTMGDNAPQKSYLEILQLLSITLGKIALFAICIIFFGERILTQILAAVARTHSRELFTIAVFSLATGIAFGASYVFGVSLALGAFFAGMILKESAWNRRVALTALPFQDAFAVLFFISVGMLFQWDMFVSNPSRLLAVVMIILLGKSLAAFFIVVLLKYPVHTALTVSVSLAQIGEFSFILANLASSYNLMPAEGHNLILAGALITITLNPFFFKCIERLTPGKQEALAPAT